MPPPLFQAACVWLLALVKKCSSYTQVQSKLQVIQMAFMNLLNEKDGTSNFSRATQLNLLTIIQIQG